MNKHNHHVMLVAGERRHVSRRLYDPLRGPKPPATFESDGCSRSPDYWGLKRMKLWPACHIHDHHYRNAVLPGNWGGRRTADVVLRWNVESLLRAQGAGAFRAKRIAWLYFGRVRIWGATSYRHWDAGENPVSWFNRFREAYGLFKAKG